jgi:hypothetical protein
MKYINDIILKTFEKRYESNEDDYIEIRNIHFATWDYLYKKIKDLIIIKDAVEKSRYTQPYDYMSLKNKLEHEVFKDEIDLVCIIEDIHYGWGNDKENAENAPDLIKVLIENINIDYLNKIIANLSKDNYTPPDTREDLIIHGLILLSSLNIGFPTTIPELIRRLSLLKILAATQSMITMWEMNAKRSPGIGKNIRIRREKSDEKKEIVIDIYKTSRTIKIGMNLSEVVRGIENVFRTRRNDKNLSERQQVLRIQDQPGTEQIKRYLKAEVLQDFKKIRGKWIKHM